MLNSVLNFLNQSQRFQRCNSLVFDDAIKKKKKNTPPVESGPTDKISLHVEPAVGCGAGALAFYVTR